MKSFDERKAEIFSRSEARLEARTKKRKLLLSMCIPVCVVVLSSALIMPKLQANKSNDAYDVNSNENPAASYSPDLLISSAPQGAEEEQAQDAADYPRIDVKEESGEVFSIIDAQTVTAIEELLDLALTPYDDSYDLSTEVGNSSSEKTGAPSIEIIISLKEGEEQHYTLKGNLLTDTRLSAATALSEAQLQRLFYLLYKKYF